MGNLISDYEQLLVGSKPPVMVWKWSEAPEELRSLFVESGGEESLILIPAAIAGTEADEFDTGLLPEQFNFACFRPRRGATDMYGGDDWGWVRFALSQRGDVVVASESRLRPSAVNAVSIAWTGQPS